MYQIVPMSALILLFSACNDPSEHFRMPPPTGGDMSGAGPGSPPPPAMGDNGAPGGSFQQGCQPTGMALERISFKAGEGVEISGRLKYDGSKSGQLLIEAMSREGDLPAQSVYHFICGSMGSGSFDLEAPESLGEVYLVAFIDQDGDGPTDSDPAGYTTNPVDIGDDEISGVEIVIQDDADLGAFTPSAIAAPAEGAGPAVLPDGVVTGLITYDETLAGGVLLDVIQVGEEGTTIIQSQDVIPSEDEELDTENPQLSFSVRILPNLDDFYLVAFLDVDGDGPTPGDPAGVSAGPHSMVEGSMMGIDIALVKGADLSAVAYPYGAERPQPGAPPEDMGPPPGGSLAAEPAPDALPAPDGQPAGPPAGEAPEAGAAASPQAPEPGAAPPESPPASP